MKAQTLLKVIQMKRLLMSTALALMATPALAGKINVCTIQYDGYAYEGPGSAIEPKQLFPIQKGERTVLAKTGKVWNYVQFEKRDDVMGWVKVKNLKCKVEEEQ
jgi:hypothetical protein